jgi:hypothetical protein
VQRRSKRSILTQDLTKEEESEINNILSSGS